MKIIRITTCNNEIYWETVARTHRQTDTHIPVRIVPPVYEGVLPPQEQGAHILLVRGIGGRGRVDNMSSILNTLTYNTLTQVCRL